MRLLIFNLHEALPGNDLPLSAEGFSEIERARRYRAVVLTTVRQLRGLERSQLRIHVTPADAEEAIRFWLLPRLADRWHADGLTFRNEGWEIAFGTTSQAFQVESHADILCPFLCARWVHTAWIGLERGSHRVIGQDLDGQPIFRAQAVDAKNPLETRQLPPLPVIRNDDHWQQALQSPLGPALKRAWDEESSS